MQTMISKSAGAPLVPKELPERPLESRDVRVAVKAVSVNPVDWKLRDNAGLRIAHWLLGPSGPFVSGIDFAGVVTEVGRSVQGVAVGDSVVGGVDFIRRQRGSYATEVIVRDTQVAVLPPHVDFQAAACLPIAGITAHQALFAQGGLGAVEGGKVLVLGASGGVGHLTVQLARNYGASVFGVCSARNAELVARLGAKPIVRDDGDPLEKALAHGPFDVVVNAVDTASYPVRRVARLLSPRGRQVLLAPSPRDFPSLVLPRVKTLSVSVRRQALEPLVKALADGKLEVVISERFPFEQAEEANQLSRAGKVVGKVVLVVGDGQPSTSAKPRQASARA